VSFNAPFNVLSLYLENEYQVTENLMCTLGIRRDEYSSVGSSTTPRAAVVYNPFKSSTLKLLYGQAFRAPSVNEANYQDPRSGFKVNTALKPEEINTAELIWEQRLTDQIFGTFSYYDYRMDNLIDTRIDPLDSLQQYQNVSRVHAQGFEAEFTARLRSGMRGYLNYSYQDAQDPDLGKTLSNSPAHVLKAGVSYPVSDLMNAAVELRYESGRITVYDTQTDGHVVTNVSLSTTPLIDHVRFSVQVRNLFDVVYATPGGFEHKQAAITQDGRNVAFNVDFRF
jgi:outer membrane receptor for ferrienterochelin and colicins